MHYPFNKLVKLGHIHKKKKKKHKGSKTNRVHFTSIYYIIVSFLSQKWFCDRHRHAHVYNLAAAALISLVLRPRPLNSDDRRERGEVVSRVKITLYFTAYIYIYINIRIPLFFFFSTIRRLFHQEHLIYTSGLQGVRLQ